MSVFSSYKKIFLLGFIIVILIAIPFSVYIAQQRQNMSIRATPATTLSLEPSSATVKVGDTVNLNIVLNPGTNQVSFAKLSIKFDASKFTAISLAQNGTGNNLKEPIDLTQLDNTAGNASISLSIGADPAKAISTRTKIATLQLKATNATSPTSSISFNSDTQVLSIASTDGTSENVLLPNPASATITVTGAATPTPTTTPITTAAPRSSGSTGGSSFSAAPVCSSLAINGPANGIAPYPLTFTATGRDSDGTISKISFNFGDSVEDLTGGGGIGTSSVSAQILHTYNTPGIYTAYATLTDNSNGISTQQDICTKTVTINSLNQPTSQLPPTGDEKIMFGLGALGVIFAVIGGALLLL